LTGFSVCTEKHSTKCISICIVLLSIILFCLNTCNLFIL
jgi:hypothetical protein